MKTWLFLAVAIAIGGGGGFILGKTRSKSSVNHSTTVVEVQGWNLSGGGDTGSLRRTGGSASGSTGGRNINVLRRELETIKRDPNPIKRFAALTDLLGDLSEENLGAVLQAFDEIPMRGEHREEYRMLVYAWASFDPEGALKFVDENANSRSINKNDLLKPVVASWATNDPEKALEWINALPENERSGNLMSGLMEGWAVKDPYKAAEYLQENVEAGKSRERLAGEIASHLFKQSPADAAKWAEAQSDLGFRSEAFEELAEDWASVNPKELAGWLEKHVDEEYSVEAFQDLARGWVSQDPASATTFFEGLPDGAAKETGIYELAVTWGKDDLPGLGEWLNGLPDSNVTDLGVKAYVNRLAQDSPAAAIESALSINGDEIRNEAVQNVGQQWFRQDPEAATAWASANGVPVESFQPTNRQIIPQEHFQEVSEALKRGIISPEQLDEMMNVQARAIEVFQTGGGDVEINVNDANIEAIDGQVISVEP
ncbi:MAG: hypothetical protein ACKVHP_07330 [Verrucomicrobiales bacterium]